MNTVRRNFTTTSDPLDLTSLSHASIIETREKEARLRKFYDEKERLNGWVYTNHTLDYLRLYQREGSKRKDGYTEDCLHQIEPCLWLASLHAAGILPDNVTYQIIKDQKVNINPAMQSIEHLFNTVHIHDIDEDFWSASRETLEKYLSQHHHKSENTDKTISYLGDASDAITFSRKINENGDKEHTHNNDPQIYLDAMERVWMAIAAKGPDRLGGLITRFAVLEKIFPYEKQKQYLNSTNRLFFYRQTLEDMERRYPELRDYFHLVNSNLSIALRCFSVILEHHPNNPDREGNPDTARIGLENYLDDAFVGANFVPLDIAPMHRMLEGYKALASRVPVFESLVTQIDDQISPRLKNHPLTVPILNNNRPCPFVLAQ